MPPPSNHACPPRATMHAPPEQPCMPPEQPCMPPPEQPHMSPQSNHACPPRATDSLKLLMGKHWTYELDHFNWRCQRYVPWSNHTHPPWSNHACAPPPPRATMHPSGSNHACPPPLVNRMTNWCKNITLPRTSFAGGKNSSLTSLVNHVKLKFSILLMGKHWTYELDHFNWTSKMQTCCVFLVCLSVSHNV